MPDEADGGIDGRFADSASGESSASHRGLTSDEASRRLAEYAPNEIQRDRETPSWLILARQFGSPVRVLVGAGVSSAAVGEAADPIAIGIIVVLNGLVGFYRSNARSAPSWGCAR